MKFAPGAREMRVAWEHLRGKSALRGTRVDQWKGCGIEYFRRAFPHILQEIFVIFGIEMP